MSAMKNTYTFFPAQIILLMWLAFLFTNTGNEYEVTGMLVNEEENKALYGGLYNHYAVASGMLLPRW